MHEGKVAFIEPNSSKREPIAHLFRILSRHKVVGGYESVEEFRDILDITPFDVDVVFVADTLAHPEVIEWLHTHLDAKVAATSSRGTDVATADATVSPYLASEQIGYVDTLPERSI